MIKTPGAPIRKNGRQWLFAHQSGELPSFFVSAHLPADMPETRFFIHDARSTI